MGEILVSSGVQLPFNLSDLVLFHPDAGIAVRRTSMERASYRNHRMKNSAMR